MSSTARQWVTEFNERLNSPCIELEYYKAVLPQPYDIIEINYCKRSIRVKAYDFMYDNIYISFDELILFLNTDAYDFIKIHEDLKLAKHGYPYLYNSIKSTKSR